ncbi:hypothetical protein NIES4102_38740 [Chondrocystis sp. NIES-4102]|nr:hypothetical protein NIES4102_38740 [Chondrocystis sp. NIES-4102]
MQNTDSGSNQAPYPNIPPLLESRDEDYIGSGVTSTVAILGHPIHPILVIFPVAFLSGAAGSDVGFFLTQDPFWARASVWLLGAGGLTGILAALVGIVDFIRIGKARERRAGWLHTIINILALVLTIVNYISRSGDPVGAIVPIGLAISLVTATLLSVGGWYGGELSFRHKIGVVGTETRN